MSHFRLDNKVLNDTDYLRFMREMESEELDALDAMAAEIQRKRVSQYIGRTIEDVLRSHESQGCTGFYVTRVNGEITVEGQADTPTYLRQS